MSETPAETYERAEHRRSYMSRDAHRTADHIHVPDEQDVDTDEIRRDREVETDVDPLAGAESALTQQSDQAEDPDQRIVGNAQTEDFPAELEHAAPRMREVHRAPTPTED